MSNSETGSVRISTQLSASTNRTVRLLAADKNRQVKDVIQIMIDYAVKHMPAEELEKR